MFKKMPSYSLGLPRTLSLQETFSKSKKRKGSSSKPVGVISKHTIQLDRFATNEGHQLVSSYLRLSQIQNHIKKGTLHKISERDIDDLLRSYEGVSTPIYETL